ncbi:MAG TPA: DUF6228 family protein [Microthrixaceae bacterium]|nr:DUF6228 family protein [Microthrixaceae bacterium]
MLGHDWEAEYPHGDELALLDIRLSAPGLDAQIGIESIDGDSGFRTRQDREPQLVSIRLADWLRSIGESRPWPGSIGWRSFADDLRLNATCDALGHVSLTISLHPWPWSQSWTATISVTYALGDLIGLADSVADWFKRN